MYNPVGRIVIALIVWLCSAGWVPSVQAVDWKEHALLPWEQETLRLFERNDFNGVMSLAKGQAEDPNWNAPLFIYYSHAQKYYLERSQDSAVYFKREYPTVVNRLNGANLAVLTRLVAMPSVAWNAKVNKKFVAAAFEHAGTDENLGALLYYLEQGAPDISAAAVEGLQGLLQRKRAIVENGGTLGKEDQRWMGDARLLRLLIRKVGAGTSPVAGFMNKLPAFARQKMIGGPSACLGLIQDPALPLLQEAAALGNANAAAAIQVIQDARGARLAVYPNSTWFSATGQ